MITISEAKAIVRASEDATWTQGTHQITHYLVVRGTAEDDPNLVIIPGLVPLASKATGEIEYVVAHAEWDRLDAMTRWAARAVAHRTLGPYSLYWVCRISRRQRIPGRPINLRLPLPIRC
jgi:hypothetical protein